MKKIILLGYMGCGKSTIAHILSAETGIAYVDLDQKIEEIEKTSINMIFQNRGEIYFRKKEHEIFVALLQSPTPLIIGLGGGTPCYANNHELLQKENVQSFYLNASISTLYNRLKNNKSKRPLLANKDADDLKEYIAKHLFDRSYYYHQAKHKVVVDDKSIEQTVSEIIALLA